jgi:hypothetical protein
VLVTTTKSEAAAAASIGARVVRRRQADLLDRLRPCFRRIESFLQARKYLLAVMSELPKGNGWTIAEHVRDRTPDKTQRLLSRASWDAAAVMREVWRFAVAGPTEAARKGRRQRGHLVIGAGRDRPGEERRMHGRRERQHRGVRGRDRERD